MPFLKLSEAQIEALSNQAETAMDVHVVSCNGSTGYVLGGRVLLLPNRLVIEEISLLLGERRDVLRQPATFDDWCQRLAAAPQFTPDNNASRASHMIVYVPSYLPPPPAAPAVVYGHLPFTAISDPNDVFYRCEFWPTSRAIDRGTGQVKPQTFAFPASELPLVPSGLAAVGRYALPNLLPACNRYELKPPGGTRALCGASVPLYGQAGGGVEVWFRNGFANRVAIPAPLVLPPL